MRADGVQWTVRGAGFALGAGGVALVALVASRSLGVRLLVEPFQARDVPVASEPRAVADDEAEPVPDALPAEAT